MSPIANAAGHNTRAASQRLRARAHLLKQTGKATLIDVTPQRAAQGAAIDVALRSRDTHWVAGQTRASFGGEVSVGGSAPGELGSVQVTNATTANAQVRVSPTAALAPRTVRVTTSIQGTDTEEEVTLSDVFIIEALTPPGASLSNVSTYAGSKTATAGFADGAAFQARFRDPAGIAAGSDDAIYVADSGNHRIRVVRNQQGIGGASALIVSTLAGDGTQGFADGQSSSARFNKPQGVAVDANGIVYVADAGNNRIRRIATDGTVTTIAGDGTAGFRDGAGSQARFNAPSGVAIDIQGNLYVADTGNSAVRFVSTIGDVRTVAGDGTIGSGDSPNARFNGPVGVAVDTTSAYIYLADKNNHRIRRLSPSDQVITIAGLERGFADGSVSQSRFADPSGIAIDGEGRLIVTDATNSLVRMVDPNNTTLSTAVTTLAGTGSRGLTDGAGAIARFYTPRGVAITSSGAIVVADTGNHALRLIGLPPVITSITPPRAHVGETVTINGQHFDGRSPDRNIVRFTRSPQSGGGQTVAKVTAATSAELAVIIPNDAATGPVTVETSMGVGTSPTAFEVIGAEPPPPAPPVPVINSFSPASGPPGTIVTLLGFALISDRGSPSVTFAGPNGRVPAAVLFESPTQVRVRVPDGAITGPIRLTNSFGTATTNGSFVVEPTPPGFLLTVAPSSTMAVEHSAAIFIVYVTSQQSTFTQLAALSTTGLPSGVTGTFNPPQITAGASSTLTVNLANSTIGPGSYSFTIRATANVDGSSLTRTAPATLNVLPAGQTTLSGRVLSTENEPIPGATASLDGRTATTDAAGAFLLVGVTAGADRIVMIDGRTATVPNRTYPVINEGATVVAGQTNVIPYTFFLPPVDVQYEVPVVPGQDTIATTPRLPDYSLTVPAGANLRNRDGSPVARMSVTPLPIDRIPAPLPPNVSTAEVWTAQPGGALSDIQMPVTYANDMHADPGTRCDLYIFDHDTARWRVYGYGRVSADGRLIVPEINPATGRPYGLDNFAWHLAAPPTNPNPSPCDSCPCAWTPNTVDLATGLKIERATDISFGGARGGLTLTRTYTTGLAVNGFVGRFGPGTKDNYDIRLTGDFNENGAGRVVTPKEGAGRLFSFSGAGTVPNIGVFVFKTTETVQQLADVVRRLADGSFEYRYGHGDVLRFDSSRRLIAMVDRNGNTTTLSYTGADLTSITDAVGRSITLEYSSGRVVRATDPLGRVWGYSYDGNGRLASVIDPLGQLTRYAYDNFGRLTSVIDPLGVVIKQITYDGNGRVGQQQFADGGIESYAYATSGLIVTSATMTDALGRVQTERFNAGGYIIGTTDALGQSSIIERDLTRNLPTSVTGPCGCLEVRRTFDEQGNAITVTDRLGQIERFTYDSVFNNLLRFTDKLGRVTTYGYDGNGNRTSMTDPLNQTTRYGYDQFGQMTSITDPLNHVTRMEHDANGNMTSRIDALDNRTMFEYDAVGRLTATVDSLGRRTSLAYDTLDRIISSTDASGATTKFNYDPNGNQSMLVNAQNRRWSSAYDLKNRLVARSDPLGHVTQYEHDAADQLITMISPSGRTTRYTYDARGQQATITDPLGGIVGFTYDNRKNLTSLTDQRGNTTNFSYDELYRPISTRDPLGRVSTISYDAVGNLAQRFDRLGRRTTFNYDALNRPSRITYADAAVTYTYDAAGRQTRIDDTQSGSIAWDYDEANRLLSETTPAGVVSYEYNAARQRVSMTPADRPPVTYGYDTAGRLRTINQSAETFTYSYDVLSRLASLQRPNNVTTTYSYDSANKLLRLTHGSAAAQPIEDFQYAYNPDDEITAITSLASATLLPTAKTVGPADAANRIMQFGPASFTFDEEGQTTSKTNAQGTTRYEWDARGRMTRAILPNGQAISYGYDALVRKTSRTAGSVTTRFIYDGQEIVLDKGTDNSAIDYLNGSGLDKKLRQTSAPTGSLYFLQDHLGSTAFSLDVAGSSVERSRYEAFGESQTSMLTRYTYTGRERDLSTELIYYRARWYDPGHGVFKSEDPVGLLIGEVNLYVYASNNPIEYADPTGLKAQVQGCDMVPDVFETRCRLKCCDKHDRCYEENKCDASSWSTCEGPERCDRCNWEVLLCFSVCGYTDPVLQLRFNPHFSRTTACLIGAIPSIITIITIITAGLSKLVASMMSMTARIWSRLKNRI